MFVIYLELLLLTISNDLPPNSSEQPEKVSIFGLSTRRYTLLMSPSKVVGSYPAFSPLPLQAVIFFCIFHNLTAIFQLRRAVLYVARTFLSRLIASDKPTNFFERETGLEPATCGLGSHRSTN